MKELIKIWNDTLKGPSGKYSRKSLTAFVCLFVAIGYAIAGMFDCCTLNIEVFFGFLGLGGGTLAMTVWDKIKPKANE